VAWAYVSVFSVPKRGSSPTECEDAAWVGPDGIGAGEVSERSLRVVVADGASESLRARKWARLLTTTFGVESRAVSSRSGFVSTYRAATDDWVAEAERYVAERQERGTPIQWYEEPGLAKGAFSTLLALEISRPTGERRRWKAAALGDSCLFLVRDEQLSISFPIDDVGQFSSRPALLPSRPAADELVLRNMSHHVSEWVPGDSFYLATDALAAWFLQANSKGWRPWEALRDLGTSDFDMEFDDWVDLKRSQGELRDDDTTLVRLDLF
jgi:Protein phosphatase 2C